MRVKCMIMTLFITIGSALISPAPIATAISIQAPETPKSIIGQEYLDMKYKDYYKVYLEKKAIQEQKQKRMDELKEKELIKKEEEQKKKAKADKEILYKISAAEAGYGDKDAIKNVVYVILNRVGYKGFPDTVEEVVFEKTRGFYQFSPISDKRYWEVDITDEIIEAVDEAYGDYDDSKKAENAIFFKATYCDANWTNYEFLFSDGRHDFYK